MAGIQAINYAISEFVTMEKNFNHLIEDNLKFFVRSLLLSLIEKNKMFIDGIGVSISFGNIKNLEEDCEQLKLIFGRFFVNYELFEKIDRNTSMSEICNLISKFTNFNFGTGGFYLKCFETFSLLLNSFAPGYEIFKFFNSYKSLFYDILKDSARIKDSVFQVMIRDFDSLNSTMGLQFSEINRDLAKNIHDILMKGIFCEHVNSVECIILKYIHFNYRDIRFCYIRETNEIERVSFHDKASFLSSFGNRSLNGQNFLLLRAQEIINYFLDVAKFCTKDIPISNDINLFSNILRQMDGVIGNGDVQLFLANFHRMNHHEINDISQFISKIEDIVNKIIKYVDPLLISVPFFMFKQLEGKSLQSDAVRENFDSLFIYFVYGALLELRFTILNFNIWVYDFPTDQNKMTRFGNFIEKGQPLSCQVI